MSAKNGGRGKPPVPPEGHGPPPQPQQIPINKEVIQGSRGTLAEKLPDTVDDEGNRIPGALNISFIVIEAGAPVQYTYTVEEPGQKAISEALNGGIEVANLSDLARLKSEKAS